ncbi:MAG: tRNA pseudouridine(55) synthase TruB [bacterium]|jgi:tRNA pseudouridine55 synthase|nr:tRNA pseudouridine(55) synthase TruB [bacterium]
MPGRPPQEALLVDRGGAVPTPAQLAGGCLVLVDKPSGPSSFAMVSLLRRLSGIRRIGHAGTLDPFASGLLILLTGQACRWQETVTGSDKRYRARLLLGRESDSHDRTGQLGGTWDGPLPSRGEIEALLPAFTGEIEQIPPMHSAVKIQGVRLYKLARRGQSVERPPRRVVVHALAVADWQAPWLDLDLHCGKGTYVRSLARDLGRALGCGALVQELRRTSIGGYEVERALDPAGLRALLGSGGTGEEA